MDARTPAALFGRTFAGDFAGATFGRGATVNGVADGRVARVARLEADGSVASSDDDDGAGGDNGGGSVFTFGPGAGAGAGAGVVVGSAVGNNTIVVGGGARCAASALNMEVRVVDGVYRGPSLAGGATFVCGAGGRCEHDTPAVVGERLPELGVTIRGGSYTGPLLDAYARVVSVTSFGGVYAPGATFAAPSRGSGGSGVFARSIRGAAAGRDLHVHTT
jgi:hypothetical protein